LLWIKRDGDKRKITGQGNGAKEYTAKAFAELKSMDRTQYDRLVQATILAGKAN
jgi:siroheme synthase